MKTYKIITEEEYDRASSKLDTLFDIKKSAPEFGQVQQLINQISMYEKDCLKIIE